MTSKLLCPLVNDTNVVSPMTSELSIFVWDGDTKIENRTQSLYWAIKIACDDFQIWVHFGYLHFMVKVREHEV